MSRNDLSRARASIWKRALITGASSGIGAAFARALAERGCDLVLVARRGAELSLLAEELSHAHGVVVEVIVADLTNRERLRVVEDRLADEASVVDLLVNNAGSETEHAPFVDRDREKLDQEVMLNALTVVRLTHAAAVAMSRRRAGAVINVSAGAAFYPVPGASAYGASKAFVNSLTEALAEELRRTGVRVTAVCPGFTRTDAQARLGLRTDVVPARFWREPGEVALRALEAAAQGQVIANVNHLDALVAFLGRHVPRAWWMRSVARTQRRLKAA